MWIVSKSQQGLEADRRPLPAADFERLMRWYVGDGDRDDELNSVHIVQTVKRDHHWIACGCLGDRNPPPLLAPAYLAMASTFYLRRLTGTSRPEHHRECPFFRSQLDYQQKLANQLEAKPLKPATGYFETQKPLATNLAQMPDENVVAGSKPKSTPKLARMLWTLIDRAETNFLAPPHHDDKATILSQFAALRRGAEGLSIAPRIPLIEHFYTHTRDLVSGSIYAKLDRATPIWTAGHSPQAFLVTFAHSISKNAIITVDGEVEIPGMLDSVFDYDTELETDSTQDLTPIHPTATIGKPSKDLNGLGPYLAIVVIARPLDGGPFQPLRAYAQPIISGHYFCPVDTVFERTVLRILLSIQREQLRGPAAFSIEKPLFDLETPDGHCRPDFMISGPKGLPLNIELTGYGNEDFQAAKDLTLPRMLHIGPTIQIELTEVAQPVVLRRDLRMQILHHLQTAL